MTAEELRALAITLDDPQLAAMIGAGQAIASGALVAGVIAVAILTTFAAAAIWAGPPFASGAATRKAAIEMAERNRAMSERADAADAGEKL